MTDVPKRPAEIRIPMDSFEYTRNGLRSRTPLLLATGQHHRLVIVRPKVLRSLAASHGGFAPKSVFPGPAVLSLFIFSPAKETPPSESSVYQVYGHCDATGSDDENKKLSDDRARVGAAMLTADVDTLLELAKEHAWGPEEMQVMLRVLQCDPGPIDGDWGSLTEDAATRFIERYAEGHFHSRSSKPPRESALDESTPSDALLAALVDAYTVAHSPHIAEHQLHPTHPWAGCAAFNPVSQDRGWLNRRLSVVIHDSLPQHHDAAPCSEGDASACAIWGDGAQRCLWFRTHVTDTPWEEVEHHNFRANWLELPNGRFLLSTLTTLPDDEELEFQVFAASEPLDRISEVADGQLLETMSEIITTRAKHGVAQIVWEPPADFAPGEDGRIVSAAHGRVVPTFRASHADTTTIVHDSLPAHDVGILFHRGASGSAFQPHEGTKLVLESQENGYRAELPSTDARPWDEEHYVLRFEGTPPRGNYTLRAVYGDGAELVVFEDVAYEQLSYQESLSGPPTRDLPPPEAAAAPDGAADEGTELPSLDFNEPATLHWP